MYYPTSHQAVSPQLCKTRGVYKAHLPLAPNINMQSFMVTCGYVLFYYNLAPIIKEALIYQGTVEKTE
jgi:hypothetical protein